MINAAVLTISDSVSAGKRADASGPAVRERLERLGWSVSAMEVLPDEAGLISARLATLASGNQVAAIFTTGGTGVAARDVTPEATIAVCQKLLPGFGEQMRTASLRHVPTAILSRQTAGIRGKTLILNLPGRPKAIRENLEAVFPAIPYCIDLIGGPRLETNDALKR